MAIEQGCENERAQLEQALYGETNDELRKALDGSKPYADAVQKAEEGKAPYGEAIRKAEEGKAPYGEAIRKAEEGKVPYGEAIQKAEEGKAPYSEAIARAIQGQPNPANYEAWHAYEVNVINPAYAAFNEYQARVVNPTYEAYNEYQARVVNPTYEALNEYQVRVVNPTYEALNEHQVNVVNPAYEAYNRYMAGQVNPHYERINKLPAVVREMSCDDVRKRLAAMPRREVEQAPSTPATPPGGGETPDTGGAQGEGKTQPDARPMTGGALPPDFQWPETEEDWQNLTEEQMKLMGEELGMEPGWGDKEPESTQQAGSADQELADFNEIEELPPMEEEPVDEDLADFNEIEELPAMEPEPEVPAIESPWPEEYTEEELQAGSKALEQAIGDNFSGDLPEVGEIQAERQQVEEDHDTGKISDKEYVQRNQELDAQEAQRKRLDLYNAPGNTIYYDEEGKSYEKLMPDGTIYTFEQKDFGSNSSTVTQIWTYPDGKSATWTRSYENQADGSGQSVFKDETLVIQYNPTSHYVYGNTQVSSAEGHGIQPQLPGGIPIQTPTEKNERLDHLQSQHRHGPWAAKN